MGFSLATNLQFKSMKIAVLAKYPKAGIAKTRLARTVGPARAAAIANALLLDLIEMLQNAEMELSVETDSPQSVLLLTKEIPGVPIYCGPGSTVPEKLDSVFSRECDGKTKVICIMADVLGLDPTMLRKAEEELERCDIIVGPDDAQGCWSVGVRRYSGLFSRVNGPSLLAESIQLAALRENHRLQFLPVLPDVDVWQDLEKMNILQHPFHARLSKLWPTQPIKK